MKNQSTWRHYMIRLFIAIHIAVFSYQFFGLWMYTFHSFFSFFFSDCLYLFVQVTIVLSSKSFFHLYLFLFPFFSLFFILLSHFYTFYLHLVLLQLVLFVLVLVLVLVLLVLVLLVLVLVLLLYFFNLYGRLMVDHVQPYVLSAVAPMSSRPYKLKK